MTLSAEQQACVPVQINISSFNPTAQLPYGLQVSHIQAAMSDFLDFLGFVNQQLHTRGMPANFSSIVGEFMTSTLPKYCPGITKNTFHNGHPDLLPTGMYPNNAAQHVSDGIEVKASRYLRGWQGHNPEDIWLMVFVFDSNRPADTVPRPFRFELVFGAQLSTSDWLLSGRSATSRRTITASVTDSGYQKMAANWIYKA